MGILEKNFQEYKFNYFSFFLCYNLIKLMKFKKDIYHLDYSTNLLTLFFILVFFQLHILVLFSLTCFLLYFQIINHLSHLLYCQFLIVNFFCNFQFLFNLLFLFNFFKLFIIQLFIFPKYFYFVLLQLFNLFFVS